jgi:hypothetical protein
MTFPSLYVWQDCDGAIYCLHGKHWSLILAELVTEGIAVPGELPATLSAAQIKRMLPSSSYSIHPTVLKSPKGGLLDFMESSSLSFNDVKLTVNFPELDMLSFGGEESEEAVNGAVNEDHSVIPVSLVERFLVPPFSVLDTQQGYWQERKRAWHALGIDSQETREDIELIAKSGQGPGIYMLRNKMREQLGPGDGDK